MEGSRKFIVMLVAWLGSLVLAKFGPSWGGLWDTAAPQIILWGTAGIYFLSNYLSKGATDVFIPENWLSGKRITVGLILALITPFLASSSTEFKDSTTQLISTAAETLTPILFMVFQHLSDKKLAVNTGVAQPVVKPNVTTASAPVAPTYAPVATASTSSASAPVLMYANTLKERIAASRATLSASWEATKAYLLGTFNARFELALKRYANINMSTIEAARRAVAEVVGVQLDDKTCQAIGQIPGFLGALGAALDAKQILPDLLAAIDKTPELAYMKKSFTNRAIWYAVKEACDVLTIRCQSGVTEDVKAALVEAGMSLWEAEKTAPFMPLQMYYTTVRDANGQGLPGTYGYRDFSMFVLAGVDPMTMESY
jgi:hypothetical protein